jgi:hypothetical protein
MAILLFIPGSRDFTDTADRLDPFALQRGLFFSTPAILRRLAQTFHLRSAINTQASRALPRRTLGARPARLGRGGTEKHRYLEEKPGGHLHLRVTTRLDFVSEG